MGSLSMVVKARKPTRLLSQPWASYASAYARNPRVFTYEDCYVDAYAKAVLLKQQLDPSDETHGQDGYTKRIWTGAAWDTVEDVWVDGEGAFGDSGGYLSYAGSETYPATTPWEVYRSGSLPLAENQPMYFSLRWVPTSANFLPRLEFWPRVDPTRYKEVGGERYYFAPLGFYIDATNSTLVVCEYEYDNYAVFDAGWAAALTPTYQHPLDLHAGGLSNGWLMFKVLPVIEKWTDAESSDDYYRHDFVLESPALRGGGFLYRTKVPRTNLTLFPLGVPGIRSLVGGIATMQMAPLFFASTGYAVSGIYWKQKEDTTYPTVTADAYEPTGTSIAHTIIRADSGVDIVDGETFQQFRVKSTLTASGSGQLETPVLYKIKPALAGSASTPAQTETDISDDVSIRESFSDDLTGYKATVSLRNRDGVYNELAYRPLNEITFQFGGVDRAVLYTLDPSFNWWLTPTEEALTIQWECGNFWERMKTLYISGMPDYGNWSIADAITDYMIRIGFEPSQAEKGAGASTKLHIASSLESIYLPYSTNKDDPLCKPQDGETAEKFIADLREKFFSTYPTAFAGNGDFWISEPLDPSDPANISRVFYLSHSVAETAFETYGGDWDDYTYFCRDPKVSLLHSQHRNEIWVVGMDPATKEPLVDYWIDTQSQTDEDYLYYVGERRLLVAMTRLPTWAHVHRFRENLTKVFWAIRRQISFTTKYDPNLMPGDFIMFYGLGFVFQVTSVDEDISAGNVVTGGAYDSTWFDDAETYYDNTVQNCRIEAVQWPLT